MKNPSPTLFDLINTMSDSERKYFLKTTRLKDKKPEYFEIFENLWNLKENDEQTIISESIDNIFPENHSRDKFNLLQLLTDFLLQLETGKTRLSDSNPELTELRFYYRRGLRSRFIKKLKKFKNKLYELEDFTLLLDVVSLEREVENDGNESWVTNNGLELLQEKQKIIDLLQAEVVMETLAKKAFEKLKKSPSARTDEDYREMKNIRKEAEKVKVNTFNSGHNYFNIKACACKYVNQIRDAVHWFKKGVELWENHPEKKELYPEKYMAKVNNLISSLHFAKEYKSLPRYIRLLRSIPAPTEALANRRFRLVTNQELIYLGNVKKLDPEAYGRFMENFEEELEQKKYLEPNSFIMAIFFNVAMMALIMGDLERSAVYLEKISPMKLKNRYDIQIMAKLFLLLISLEKKAHPDTVEKHFSAGKYLTGKNKDAYKLESKLLYLIKKQEKFIEKEDLNTLQQKILKTCENSFQTGSGYSTGIEELAIWAKAKLTEKSMFQIYREMY